MLREGRPHGTGPAGRLARSRTRSVRWAVHLSRTALVVAALLLRPTPSLADDADDLFGRQEERVGLGAPPEGWLRTLTPRVQDTLSTLSEFWQKTDLTLHLRTYYLDRQNSDNTASEAWAGGGWLAYESGPAFGHVSVGAVGYTSQPIYAPGVRDTTNLLTPDQDGITVLGEAFGRFRYGNWEDPDAILTGYRQRVEDGYVNKQDSRMIPNTFEGVTLKGQVGLFGYNLGYLWDIKPRNSDEFIPMSAQAAALETPPKQGVPDEGLVLTSMVVGEKKDAPDPNKYVHFGNYYVPDLFNTAFGALDYDHVMEQDARRIGIAFQYTDQRSVGADSLGSFSTGNLGVRLRYLWRVDEKRKTFTVEAAGHVTSDEARIRSPWGSWPGYLGLLVTDFNRRGEKAWGLNGKYEMTLSEATSLSFAVAYAQGTDRLDNDPGTKKSLPTTREVDVDVQYKYSKRPQKGDLRFRAGFVDDGKQRMGYQLRFIFNYEVDLF